jgi:hypothetical protein
MSKLTTGHKAEIFATALEANSLGTLGGAATIDRLKQAFASMKSRLAVAGADEEDERTFLAAVERAIMQEASKRELSPDNRGEVRDALRSAFDGMTRGTESRAVEYNFVSRVRFDD